MAEEKVIRFNPTERVKMVTTDKYKGSEKGTIISVSKVLAVKFEKEGKAKYLQGDVAAEVKEKTEAAAKASEITTADMKKADDAAIDQKAEAIKAGKK